ncbi:KilA N-terminal/APSES-type HTH DNA-binding [Penicillium frequentans]|uniref:Cell pattern formation-associated protein stuA n=1 Tax=Penicillium frequentans TaxID=3151616 RepID=A0AAD6CWT4_9EURO|nr:KilA N-terminal/APSES-type HTH DNA-binding [Penicillium glabrum]
MDTIYSATYSNVPVYEFKIDGDSIMRRRSDDWVNATHVLKAAGFDKPARTRILEREVQKGNHEKVQGGYGKYQGTWIPLPEARMLAERNNVIAKLAPIFDYVAGDRSPPPAPKHTSAASKPRAPRKSAKNAAAVATEAFSVIQPTPNRSMGPPTLTHEQYEMSNGFDDNESIEQANLETSSMMADEDMHLSMSFGGRKRKRGMNEGPTMTITEQEHIMYGDQLLDYFMTVGDAPQATRIQPPVPPAHFQIDRQIDDSGNTALHWACAMGDLEIVQDLLHRGANAKSLSIHEETPLVRAVLFTNNYEKRTFPTLLDVLLDTITFRDWFGATIFHHVAETTRSKGKWKSSKYYCDILLDKLCKNFSHDEVDLLLACQDDNGDTAALVAARNGSFRLVKLLTAHCPRSADLVNKKGETASQIIQRSQLENDIPPAPSSVTMANDHMDGEMSGIMPSDRMSIAPPPIDPAANQDLLSKISAIMAEANKKLTVTYSNTKVSSQDSTDVANPEALFEQLESDREKIQKQVIALGEKEAMYEPSDNQLRRYEKLRGTYESLLERVQYDRLVEKLSSAKAMASPNAPSLSPEELIAQYQLARELCAAQKKRRNAVRDLAQQTADAGVSTKFDVHRKLVALATGLKEEELDPMAAELAETLEFDRLNGKGTSPEPGHHRLPSQVESAPLPSGPVDN